MADKHVRTIKCSICSKQAKIKTSFSKPTDITHIVEIVMKMEEKGWTSKCSIGVYRTTRLNVDLLCETCSPSVS